MHPSSFCSPCRGREITNKGHATIADLINPGAATPPIPLAGDCWPNVEQDALLQAALLEGPSALDAWRKWKATANIEADPIVAEAVDEGLLELKDGHGVSWSSLRQELDL